jgi:hypothetical protein
MNTVTPRIIPAATVPPMIAPFSVPEVVFLLELLLLEELSSSSTRSLGSSELSSMWYTSDFTSSLLRPVSGMAIGLASV